MRKGAVIQYTQSELLKFSDSFMEELKKADAGKATDFAYSIHEFYESDRIPDESQLMVIGGSNFQSCRVINNRPDLENIISEELPLMTSEKILMDVVYRNIHSSTKYLAVNFAFPLTPVMRDNRLDGILIRGTKGHTLDDCINRAVGEIIENHCREKGLDIKVSLANDTICLILAGLESGEKNNLVGGVVGTGFNFGFFKDNSTVVNLESGNFKKFTVTDTGAIIDKESSNQGEQFLEKEVGGAYLFKHYNILKGHEACNNTEELSMLAEQGDEVAQNIFERSASLVAAEIAAIYFFKEKKQITCIIEGSLFWKGWNFKEFVYEYCEKLGVSRESLETIYVEHSSLKGAMRLL